MEDSILCTPEPIKSPFLNDITQCRASMRKLRKKIYKYTVAHRENRKPKNLPIQDVVILLKGRNIPDFVIEQVTKKRTFDFSNIKNVNVSQEASLEEITKRTQDQENQIKDLFNEHKSRLKVQNTPRIKFDRRPTALNSITQEWEFNCSENGSEQVDEVWGSDIHVSEFRLTEEDPLQGRFPLQNLLESRAIVQEHQWFKF